VGLPEGDSFSAYSLLNAGPGGGYNSQSVTLTVWATNLSTGTTYTITVTMSVTTVPGGVVTTTQVTTFVASTATMGVPLPTIVAAPNTIVQVMSATIA